jgi:Ca2+-binding RTX toxin-like protein
VLSGGTGHDTITAGTSTGLATGADGDDTFQVSGVLGVNTQIDGGVGTDTIVQTGALNLAAATVIGFERLALSGAGNAVTLTAAQLDAFATIAAAQGATSGALALSTPTAPGVVIATEVVGLASLIVTGSADRDALSFATPGPGAPPAITVNAGGGDDAIVGGGGNDTLLGEAGSDSLLGGTGADLLGGGASADTLIGGGGNDTLVGEAGNDRLTGGAGADHFRFSLPTEARDTITDFNSALGDRIEISAGGFAGGLEPGEPLDPSLLRVGTSNSATTPDGVGQFIFNTTNRLLLWDADGSGLDTPVGIAVLSGVATLAASDFVIVA